MADSRIGSADDDEILEDDQEDENLEDEEEPPEDKNQDDGDEDESEAPRQEDKRLGSSETVSKAEFDAERRRNERNERRLNEYEWREFQRQKTSLEREYKESERKIERAERLMAEAIANADGEDAASAIRYRDEVLGEQRLIWERYQQLENVEKEAQNPKPKPDPVVNSHAKAWISKNPWYDINGANEDSRVVLEIDGRLANEGYMPRTELYWQELDKRVRKNLPHRYKTEKEQVNTAKLKEVAKPKRKEIYISKERKEALVAAGVWDDPALRHRYVKQYQKWDRENSDRSYS